VAARQSSLQCGETAAPLRKSGDADSETRKQSQLPFLRHAHLLPPPVSFSNRAASV